MFSFLFGKKPEDAKTSTPEPEPAQIEAQAPPQVAEEPIGRGSKMWRENDFKGIDPTGNYCSAYYYFTYVLYY